MYSKSLLFSAGKGLLRRNNYYYAAFTIVLNGNFIIYIILFIDQYDTVFSTRQYSGYCCRRASIVEILFHSSHGRSPAVISPTSPGMGGGGSPCFPTTPPVSSPPLPVSLFSSHKRLPQWRKRLLRSVIHDRSRLIHLLK